MNIIIYLWKLFVVIEILDIIELLIICIKNSYLKV